MFIMEKILESLLNCKEIKPVNQKVNQSWTFIGRTNTEAGVPTLRPPDMKNWLLEKTLMLEKIEGRRKRGWQNEMVGWHHRLDGHEFEQALEVGDGQKSLVCCGPWVTKSQRWLSDWTELIMFTYLYYHDFLLINIIFNEHHKIVHYKQLKQN